MRRIKTIHKDLRKLMGIKMILKNLKSETPDHLQFILSKNKKTHMKRTNRPLFKPDISYQIHTQNSVMESISNMVLLVILAIILIIICIPIIELLI